MDPAELSPGQFTNWVKAVVERDDVRFLVIDSLSMPCCRPCRTRST